ncbi:hypothetical protein ABZP36_006992 [Zizania latifolia]
MGFNSVRLTWPTYLAHQLHAGETAAAVVAGASRHAGARRRHPCQRPWLDSLTCPHRCVQGIKEVLSALARNSIMVIPDNQMTTSGWCCSRTDGNGCFGDKYFDPEEWLNDLSTMVTMFRNTKNVVGMILRNELWGPYQNVSLWYRYMQLGAEVVHEANPDVLVILSGLDLQHSQLLVLKSTSAIIYWKVSLRAAL